ncbi:hypothetical protein ET475_00520 [Microbacterium protaetiae]|uniref:DUF2178 domain-containing protein n=1 Tax=Microbacterium protaetiae TaxID=2509458 RepID=A0A4P6E9N1_9MICO|nr:hypothetical protein ET475_00520 [Microbacterium protaetiae]
MSALSETGPLLPRVGAPLVATTALMFGITSSAAIWGSSGIPTALFVIWIGLIVTLFMAMPAWNKRKKSATDRTEKRWSTTVTLVSILAPLVLVVLALTLTEASRWLYLAAASASLVMFAVALVLARRATHQSGAPN